MDNLGFLKETKCKEHCNLSVVKILPECNHTGSQVSVYEVLVCCHKLTDACGNNPNVGGFERTQVTMKVFDNPTRLKIVLQSLEGIVRDPTTAGGLDVQVGKYKNSAFGSQLALHRSRNSSE